MGGGPLQGQQSSCSAVRAQGTADPDSDIELGFWGRVIVMRLTHEQLAIVITWAKRTPEVLAGDTQSSPEHAIYQ
jgi:hypothetical protein